jgi:hypothetical protein
VRSPGKCIGASRRFLRVFGPWRVQRHGLWHVFRERRDGLPAAWRLRHHARQYPNIAKSRQLPEDKVAAAESHASIFGNNSASLVVIRE